MNKSIIKILLNTSICDIGISLLFNNIFKNFTILPTCFRIGQHVYIVPKTPATNYTELNTYIKKAKYRSAYFIYSGIISKICINTGFLYIKVTQAKEFSQPYWDSYITICKRQLSQYDFFDSNWNKIC